MRIRAALVPVALAVLSRMCAAQTPPTVGIVDDRLVRPYEWAKSQEALWTADACRPFYERAGFRVRVLTGDDLTAHGLIELSAVVIVGDHVYPEHGAWGGEVLGAIADFVRRGGVYVMAIGVPHYVARDLASGSRDSGHWGPDRLGLTFEQANPAGPVRLTKQGRDIGLPSAVPADIQVVRAPADGLDGAILAWDASFTPAMTAIRIGRGWAIHCGCGENMSQAYRDWWFAASAIATRAALGGKLVPLSLTKAIEQEGVRRRSLDDLDREAFGAGPSPMQTPATRVLLRPIAREGVPPIRSQRKSASLDGRWDMVGCDAGKGREQDLIGGRGWKTAVPAAIPCSVHTALLAAGKIPDPSIGFNADIARVQSFREWWFRKEFRRPAGMRAARLCLDGVDYSCTVWLNGARLGRHEGPFGGPEFEVSDLLRDSNTLVVRVDPAPTDWTVVLKTNVVYGWHYVNLPSLGIWRSVHLEGRSPVEVRDPFVTTRDARKGLIDLSVSLVAAAPPDGVLEGFVAPVNHAGKPCTFTLPVRGRPAGGALHFSMFVPDPHLWWPVDMGRPDLYRLTLRFRDRSGGASDVCSTTFGIRTIETRPLPEGPRPNRYNWTFVVNGRPMFLKGANWCILDALLRLDRTRYNRFLTLARDQHVQLLRAWGGGLLENDAFYDLCDRLGVMVYQEFPLTWQKFDLLSPSVVDETAVANVKRLRNHPSLAMWGGGNEHSGQGRAVEQIGRICLEMDGSRPFHRTDPYGGSLHNYDVYWGRQPLDRNLKLEAPFIGEFGLCSPPNLESVLRYLPPSERATWPPPDTGSFVKHTPTFAKQHIEIMSPYAALFDNRGTMEGFIDGMQLAQAEGLRHTLERARTRWPDATGICYYKLTDVYPACAWATVDWYGAPKIAYHFIRNAYAPLHTCAIFDRTTTLPAGPTSVPIYLLDDAGALSRAWSVQVRRFDASLNEKAQSDFSGSGSVGRVRKVGVADLPGSDAASSPAFLVTEVRAGGAVRDRTWYFLNYESSQGCLFRLPKTRLSVNRSGSKCTVTNTGSVPAVGVHFVCPSFSDTFRSSDDYLWLDVGESRTIDVSRTDGVQVIAWNAPPASRR